MQLAIIGSGSWGTALAISSARAGSRVVIWSRSNVIAADINNNRQNSAYLPGILLENITATTNINDIVTADALLLVVPAQELRGICKIIAKLPENIPLVICAKGIEQGTLALLSQVVFEYFPQNPIAILSGPNFADEIAKGLPACATIASADKAAADLIIKILGNKFFRLYYSKDLIGAQIGGAVKNIIAIAAGIAFGLGLGENARAALVTRGLAEISRLSIKLGGRSETLAGLSGIGDIMLTCSSEKSRNMWLGMQISHGRKLTEILQSGKIFEGVKTAESVTNLAENLGIDMPITAAVKAILFDNVDVRKTVQKLLDRPFVVEA